MNKHSLWIARGKDGRLDLFNHKPLRTEDGWVRDPEVDDDDASVFYTIVDYRGSLGYWWNVMLDKFMFSEVTWENSPKELTIKEE